MMGSLTLTVLVSREYRALYLFMGASSSIIDGPVKNTEATFENANVNLSGLQAAASSNNIQ
jgi:hypothetical protein